MGHTQHTHESKTMANKFEITELARFQDAVERPFLIADHDLTDYCGMQADLNPYDDGPEPHTSQEELAELEANNRESFAGEVPF